MATTISDEEERNSSLCDEEKEDRQGGCTVCRERNSYTKTEEGRGRRGGRAVAGSPVGSLPVGPCRQWTGSGSALRAPSASRELPAPAQMSSCPCPSRVSHLQARVDSFIPSFLLSRDTRTQPNHLVYSSKREEYLLKANYCCCSLEDGSAAAAAVSPSLPMRMLREPHSQLALMLLSLTPSENST